jgi:N-acetylglutamate synthase-like GNAT family acetyltransferase
MAVREDIRRRGLGAELIEMAESEAVHRGCKHAFVDTMDYQAPNFFYIKLGYCVVCQLDYWDSHGHSKFHLRKRLP